jgi:hypothetical protein
VCYAAALHHGQDAAERLHRGHWNQQQATVQPDMSHHSFCCWLFCGVQVHYIMDEMLLSGCIVDTGINSKQQCSLTCHTTRPAAGYSVVCRCTTSWTKCCCSATTLQPDVTGHSTCCCLFCGAQVHYIMDEMLLSGCIVEPDMPAILFCCWLPCDVYVQVHYIMDEMLLNGCIVDTNKINILEPVQLLENVPT